MRPLEEFELAMKLVTSGMNDCAIARATGIPRRTIMDWRHKSGNGWKPGQESAGRPATCPICNEVDLDECAYAYLLGLYLGDGCLALHPRNVFRLRISLDQAYPNIISECMAAIDAIKSHGQPAGRTHREGCDEIYSFWKHWICLFPQHGPGPKHLRDITLEPWQEQIVAIYPASLIRGLIHSDGCRYINRVGAGYEYVNYEFTNNSAQIQAIFTNVCDRLGIGWRRASWKIILITRRSDVSKMEALVGPKS